MSLTPEQKARQQIDAQLVASGWIVQDKKELNFHAGPADYVPFVDQQADGIIPRFFK